ncbi:MAG: zinc-finger domain-containing protein [Alphaproteobacteria bacterium]
MSRNKIAGGTASKEDSTMEPVEIVVTDKSRVACDGGKGGLGHPRVYLTLTKDGEVDCPYCGRRYVSAARAESGSE